MKTRIMGLTLMFALLGAFVLAPLGAKAAPPAPLAVPTNVTGDTDSGATFEGVFTITEIVNDGGNLLAVGTLTGTLTDALGNILGTADAIPLEFPLTATGSCEILNLVLGPLDLDLLGLVVHLDQVVLNITAESGPGNLLGNLLCAVANLLNSNASGNALANMLNRILGLLG